jgi:multiple sugar transport system substrate-binding protein
MGGDVVLESKTQPGKYHAGYNNDGGRKALKFYIDAVYVDKWDSFEVKHDAEAFELGTAAMFFRESNVVGDIAQKVPGLPYDTALIPSDVRSGTMKITDFFFVTKSCKNPEVAYDFVLFMVNDANERWLLDNVGWPPSRNDVDYSPVYAKTPQFRVFVEKVPDGYVEYNNTRGLACFDEILTRLAERLATAYLDSSLANNPAGIAKAIADAAEETNAILRRNGVYAE